MSTKPNPQIGSPFDEFLAEEGMLDACNPLWASQLPSPLRCPAAAPVGIARKCVA